MRITTSACRTAPTRPSRGPPLVRRHTFPLHMFRDTNMRSARGANSLQHTRAHTRTRARARAHTHTHSLSLARALLVGTGDYSCTDLVNNRACWGGNICTSNCYPTETIANNFIVLRSMTGIYTCARTCTTFPLHRKCTFSVDLHIFCTGVGSRFGNTLYAEFATGDQTQTEIDFKTLSFKEYYELDTDPWMMDNKIHDNTTPVAALSAALHEFFNCQGDACP